MTESLPWHALPWSAFRERLARGRLPHAWLLAGPAGLGKRAFAGRVAAALLCESPGDDGACGDCRGCRLFAGGSHPDFVEVRLLRKGEYAGKKKLTQDATQLLIDQVRDLSAALALSAQRGGYKVAVIDPADRLGVNAANALLKTLEEPTPDTLILLAAAQPARLPATVRSRCQRLDFARPDADDAFAWLRRRGIGADDLDTLLTLADGSPLRAEALAAEEAVAAYRDAFDAFGTVVEGRADPVAVASAWSGLDQAALYGWLAGWVVDMIRLKSAAQPPRLDALALAPRLQALAQAIDLDELFRRLEELTRARRLAETQVNAQLLCEETLLGWNGQRNG